MPHFFIQSDYENGDTLSITGEEHHHLAHVHRYKHGDVIVVKSSTHIYEARIEAIEKALTVCRVLSKTELTRNRQSVTAAIPLLKSGNTDLALQKCTELGIESFYIVSYERSVPGIGEEKNKTQRWQRIIHEASKQCMRQTVPRLEGIISSYEFFRNFSQTENKILLDLVHDTRVTYNPEESGTICYTAGPEGGYSEKERNLALECGWQSRCFNKNQLRAETAIIAFASIIMSI